jgi:hypothetical protein
MEVLHPQLPSSIYTVIIRSTQHDLLPIVLLDDDSIMNEFGVSLGGIGKGNGNAVSRGPLPFTAKQNPLLAAQTNLTDRTIRSLDNVVGWMSSIQLSKSETPVITYYDHTNGDLKLTRCFDVFCKKVFTRAIASEGDVGYAPSLVLTASGFPVITYHDSTNVDLFITTCADELCEKATTTTIDSEGQVGLYSSVGLTSAGIPVVSYYDQTNGDLKLALCDSIICSSPIIRTLDSAGEVGWTTSLVLTPDNNPIISYYDHTNGNLKLAICRDPSCLSTIVSTLDTEGNIGRFSSVELTASGYPVVSYNDETNGTLKYLRCTDALCSAPEITVLDNSSAFVGAFTSLELKSDGGPAISYYDWSNRVLKFATCKNVACEQVDISIIDSAGDVGKDNSLALTSNDIPIISYLDNGNGSLKLNFGNMTIDHGEPNSFAKKSPADKSIARSRFVELSWQSSAGATTYEYCISAIRLSCNTWTSVGTATKVLLAGLTNQSTYFWFVRSSNLTGTRESDNTKPWQFTVSLPPDPFTKLTPRNNTANAATTVNLSWQISRNATNYEYCIGTNPSSCDSWKDTGTVQTARIANLAKNTTYYWQVRAKNVGNTTLSNSPVWSFKTTK